MNNLITEHFLQQFRLRSARNKIRMQHEDFEKKLRALAIERRELYKQQRELGWIELEKPIVRGWKRYFVLREDVARSKQKAFFETLLEKINTVQLSHRKDFKKKKRQFGKKIYVDKQQYPLPLSVNDILKLKVTEKELAYFEEREIIKKPYDRPVKRFVFTEPWRFTLRIRPNLITKVRAQDTELEQRITEISNYIDQNNLKGKVDKLLYGYSWRWWKYEDVKAKQRNPFKHKSLVQILDICNQEND
jgi:hypothetical protein